MTENLDLITCKITSLKPLKDIFTSFIFSMLLFGCMFVQISAQVDENDAAAIFNKAQDAHEKGELAAALKLYEEALKIAPEFAEAEYQRGNIFLSLGKIAEAENSFLHALKLRGDWNLPKERLAEVFLMTKRFADAEKILSEILRTDDKNFSLYPLLTEARINLKTSPDTLKKFLAQIKTLNTAQPNSLLFASQGAIESSLGNLLEARESLENALALQPNNLFALSQLIEVLIARKDFAAAEITAQKLLALRPNSKIYKLQSAKALANNSKISEAMRILESLDANDADVAAFKSSIVTATSEDVSELEKQLSANPKDKAILSRLCVLTRKTPAKALDYCRKASEAEPDNINHAIGYAAALVQARQFSAAENLLRRLLTLEADNFTAHANLAAALFEQQKFAEAKSEYQWLISSNPNLSIAYYFLAISNDNLQQYKEAFDNYKMFLKLADAKINQLEIEKVNLRLPILEKQIKKLK